VKPSVGTNGEILWQTASRLLELERIISGDVQEVSANYDATTHSCPLFADFGRGNMQSLGITLPAERVEAGIRLLAAIAGKVIDPEDPFLNLVLRNGARFSASTRPASDGPTFSIRTHWRPIRPLTDFVSGFWQLALIDRAIRQGDNIVVAGATNAGKTTFVNALAARLIELRPDDRLATIEDEPELRVEARNAIRRVARGNTDLRRHVREVLRMRPDRIIIGEVRGPEALDLLKAWNTGHAGNFTTVHANNARAALLRLESLVEEAGVPPNPRMIAESVNLLIFIARDEDGSRRIKELVRVEGYEREGGYRLRELKEE
jgi:type IV secretion system protein VirB11